MLRPVDSQPLLARTRAAFQQHYARPATHEATAPARANLIGEHTDYNDGLVAPFALARRTAVVATRRSDRTVRGASAAAPGTLEVDLDAPIRRGEPRWGDYLRGVLDGLLAGHGFDPGGFDAFVDSDIPLGAGLSSSAALEVAFATLCEKLAGRDLEPMQKVELCRLAEHRFAGVPCGIMDQAASVLGREDALLLLDCRDASTRLVPFPRDEVELVVVDSRLPHDLGEGAFARRVAECREAAARLGVASLRDATPGDLARLAADPLLQDRARHVVEENARVLAAVAAVESRDWPALGRILDEGHASLRDLYEVSRPGMDDLVADLRDLGALGARMTGGGFGGCAVALFRRGDLDAAALEAGLLRASSRRIGESRGSARDP